MASKDVIPDTTHAILKNNFNRKHIPGDFLLLLLFICMSAVIFLRLHAESTGYVSPDSKAYLELAQNLKNGDGFYVLRDGVEHKQYFSTWPIGYPVLIYMFSEASTLDVYWSSKVLNVLLLGFGFLLLRHIYKPYAFLLASVYGAYTFLEVYSFTWSEAPFLLGLLLLAYLANQVCLKININRNVVLIFFTCLTLFLLRYIGLFSFVVPALLALQYYYTRDRRSAAKLVAATFLLFLFAVAYLYTNYAFTGYATGFDRLEDETEGPFEFLTLLLHGLLNELLIIREYRSANQPDWLLYVTVIVQAVVMVYIIKKVKLHYNFWHEIKRHSFAITCLSISSIYLLSLITLRLISYFDAPDFRLLSPFSFLAFIGLIYTFASLPDVSKGIVRAKYMLFAFLVMSMLLNLPKKHILNQFSQLFQ